LVREALDRVREDVEDVGREAARIQQGAGSVVIRDAAGNVTVKMGDVVQTGKNNVQVGDGNAVTVNGRKQRYCVECGAALTDVDGVHCAAHKKSYITLTARGREIAESLLAEQRRIQVRQHIRHAAYAVGAVALLVVLTILGVLVGRR